MEVERVDTYVVGAGWKNWCFVRLETDTGLVGIGEATLNGFGRTCEAAVRELAPLVLGADPRRVRTIASDLYHRVSNEGGHVHRTAIAGYEVACWDILGKSLGVPVHQLLGGKVRDAIPAYANGWYRTERTPEDFARAATVAVAMGFQALKLDPLGSARGFLVPGELERSREIVAAVRAAVGPRVRLLVDVHARLAPSEAVALVTACSDLDVFWWEEPTTRQAEPPTSDVANRVTGRIATGENFHTVGQFLSLLRGGGVSILQPEPMSLGGILPTLAVAELAAADGGWIAPHQSGGPVATAVCLQLAACIPNFLVQEHFDRFNAPWTADLVTWTPALNESTGELSLPEAPGIGLNLDVDVASAHPYDPDAFLDVYADGWEMRLGQRRNRDGGER
ncbi:MAG: mandelate racemase/muconate lactonizing enzyme family protein [Actinomycetota bacterium]|nr:mandelate racemase/muconate lactonizing enzyme family protein [Actinomycetota bacterium]